MSDAPSADGGARPESDQTSVATQQPTRPLPAASCICATIRPPAASGENGERMGASCFCMVPVFAITAFIWRRPSPMSQLLEMEVPDDLLLGLQKDAKHLTAEMRIAAAIKWYQLGQLTQGKAADVAGLSRAAFINELTFWR
jgi:Uncharacterised protein family (UPF0175)